MKYSVDVNALKKLMIDNNIETIQELEEKSGVNRNTLSKILKGEIRPSTSVMERLIFALNIEPINAGPIFFVPDLRIT